MKETLINNNATETKDYFHILTTLYAKAKIKLSKQTAENKDLNDRLKSLEVFYSSITAIDTIILQVRGLDDAPHPSPTSIYSINYFSGEYKMDDKCSSCSGCLFISFLFIYFLRAFSSDS